LTGGQAYDTPAFQTVLCDVPDETVATTVVADRACDSDLLWTDMEAVGFERVIPLRKNRRNPPS
jgi:hypothetical protein